MKYDENQLKAINATDGYFLVLAPPGCGKTNILAERIARAHEKGVDFADMLCLTFTNRASRGMSDRIRRRLAERGQVAMSSPLDVFVGNIHRYCSKYLFNNAVVPEDTSIIDEDEQADIFLSYDHEAFFSTYSGINKNAVKYVADLASYIQQSWLNQPEDVRPGDSSFPGMLEVAEKCNFKIEAIPAINRFLRYALMYIQYKKERNIIDFQDILILAYQHMREDTGHRRYPWIQVDEVQDLNSLQLAIIDELTAPRSTVMYLGDEQQAIFSFMGAKLSILSRLKERCSSNILTLGNNYRSPKYLLDICNDYAAAELGVDPELLPTSTDNPAKEKLDVILTEAADVKAERERIVNMVKYYLGLHDKERLAILVTKNKEADEISATLSRHGISNFKISGTDMFKTAAYKTLSSFYCVLANDFNTVAWARLIYGVGALPTLVKARALMDRLSQLMMTPSDLLGSETYLQRFMRYYQGGEMVMFDTETTGLNVFEDEIVQIAAFKVKNGVKIPGSDFDILMHTDREIPPMLGDIVNPLVERYASNPHYSREEGLRMFLDYVGTCPLLGHNVTYDYLILKSNVERTLSEAVEYDIFDSLHIIKCVQPGLRKYKLEFLVKELGLIGKNSHLANEDIEATKSLIDYCVSRIAPVQYLQEQFLNEQKVASLCRRLQVLAPLFKNIRSYIHTPTNISHHTIADELMHMHNFMVGQALIKDLGPKFHTFLRYVQSEWVDPIRTESLYDQISAHIYDITSSINEGDLVNSEELLQDRVFIMTVYKGKGLEFENVVVLGAVDGTYPFYKINEVLRSENSSRKEKNDAMAMRMEDARKFYVAISRAKKRLCVSFSRFNSFNRYAGMTPFMRSIMHHFHYSRKS